MDFRAKRQLIILGIVAAFFIIAAGGLVYKLVPEPTCVDNRQNQSEEGVDCGGPCLSCALKEARPVEVFWTRFVKTREQTYDVAAEIKNPNARLAVQSFEYEFRLIDSAGVIVAARSGRAFLYPGELAHIVEIGLKSGRDIKKATFSIANVEWKTTNISAPDVIAGSKEHGVRVTDGLEFSAVKAVLTNRSSIDLKSIQATVILFDRDGNFVAASFSIIDSLGAGKTHAVEWRWPVSFGNEVAGITVESRTPFLLGR